MATNSSHQQSRQDPKTAQSVVDSIFREAGDRSKQAYLKFLLTSIQMLSGEHADRWGITLWPRRIRLNVGWVECLILNKYELSVLVQRKSSPSWARFVGRAYKTAPGCRLVKVPLEEIDRFLPSLSKSHQAALSVAAARPCPRSIREAHSIGITKFLSQEFGQQVADPSYLRAITLHLVNGGYGNDDKRFLERAAGGSRSAISWVVPKSSSVGDEVVINVAGQGLFATARIASKTHPKSDLSNRYGAKLDSITLIRPPISLFEVRERIPKLEWARYPRSITTPSDKLAESVRDLVRLHRYAGSQQEQNGFGAATPDEIMKTASFRLGRDDKPIQRIINQYIRRDRVKAVVLRRANGICEGCGRPAPFRTAKGRLFLETHHTQKRAEAGSEHPRDVIALCPNCHRRTEYSEDSESFNRLLVKHLKELMTSRKSL